ALLYSSSFFTRSLHDALPIFFILTSRCLELHLRNHETECDVVQEEPDDADRYDDQEVGLVVALQYTEQDVIDEAATECLTDRDKSEEHTSELQSRFDLVCRLL